MIATVLLRFWKPIALALAVAGLVGGVYYWRHQAYLEGYKAAEVKYLECKHNFEQESRKWQAEVERQKKELEQAKTEKKEIVKRNFDMFKESNKKTTNNRKETTNEIKATIAVDDVVTVPRAFISVYNHAIEGSRVTQGDSGEAQVPDYSIGTKAAPVTFNATYFTETVKGNIDEYNSLATRCNALIDIVEKLEIHDGTYTEGSDGPIEQDRGNATGGSSPADLRGNRG